jgi:group I intron endonuclease
MSIIYLITNTINDKKYVGQTKYTLEKRLKEHFLYQRNYAGHFHDAIRKYGSDCWIYEIIAEYDDEILDESETYWISYFDTYQNGYNETEGGRSGYRYTEEVREKMSKKKLGYIPWNKGRRGDIRGPLPESTKIKIGNAHRGKIITDEVKLKMSQAKLGRYHSEETKEKMRRNNWGANTWNERNPLPIDFDKNLPKRFLSRKYNVHRRVIQKWLEIILDREKPLHKHL